jgi:hypothetical protein
MNSKPRSPNPVLLALLAAGTIGLIGDGATARMYDYHQGGGVTTRQLRRLNYYSERGQTTRDIRRLIGSPNRISSDQEEYVLRETVDYSRQGTPINAGRRLIIYYNRDGYTTNWHVYP